MRVAVFYIWVPGEQFKAHTERFVKSYERHPAGCEHDLILICKADTLPRAWPKLPARECVAVGEPGFDVGPFLELAPRFADYDRLVLLGAYARILDDGWLRKLTAAGRLCSATGSFEVRPHLRSNCISIDPALLADVPACVSKQDCWDFEHGVGSIYERSLANETIGLVVGRDGAYRQSDWPRSRTYRSGGQQNLLCADNHTDAYQNATGSEQRKLEQDAWAARTAPITVLTVTIPGRDSLLANVESVYGQSVPVARQLLCAHLPASSGQPQVQYSAAKNDLLAAVDTEWVAVLNDDDCWLPEHVETMLPELGSADVIYSWDAGGSRPRIDCNEWTRTRLSAYFEKGNFLDGNCLIRRAMLEQVGGFPVDWEGASIADGGHYADSPATYEDWELWRRLVKAGARFRCVPKETWRYGTSASNRLSRAA